MEPGSLPEWRGSIGDEEPDEEEGYKIFYKKSHLENFSTYKFDIPGLLIQIEAIYVKSDSPLKLKEGLKEIFMHWNEQNPVGRIIFIQYGNRELPKEIQNLLSRLAKELEFPVYLFHIVDPTAAGPFSEPPNPGILAFLQKRHCLFLHCTKTVYIYNTQDHMDMARAAGVNCVKMTQILHNPALVIGSHVITRSPVPEYLRTMEILPTDQTPSGTPSLPCVTEKGDFLENCMTCRLPQGRQEFIFAKDFKTILSYQELYQSCVSVLRQQTSIYTQSGDEEDERDPDQKATLNDSTRKLPSWMIGMETPPVRKNTPAKTSLCREETSSSTEGHTRETVYVMTEEELREAAIHVLKQAGRNVSTATDTRSVSENLTKETKIDLKNKKPTSATKIRNLKTRVLTNSNARELDRERPGPSRDGTGRNCAVLEDLMADTGVRRASPRKTRTGLQLKKVAEGSNTQKSPLGKRLRNTDKETPKNALNVTDQEFQHYKSEKFKTGESFELGARLPQKGKQKDPTETQRCVWGDSEGSLPDSQEPGPSDVFHRTRLKPNQNLSKHTHTDRSETAKSQVREPMKRRTESSDTHSPKIRKTVVKSDPETTRKPDLSILDEIFF
ncbi:uncharacterized protein LOC125659399 isoform X2 [Ostrea edulis]|uniref:uncharacterized protein LOC125659399 isoform X2 n=1 Tax=Ostrea edulis TaxID=37623 RepID=UPI0024AF9998|nr:uncharacterized protein LOC125659399 isoform X2 [Ostrea edulis]